MIRDGSGEGVGMKAWERSSEWGPGCDPLLFLGAPPRWDKISEPFTGAIILMMCFTPSPDPLLLLYISIHGLGAIGVSRGNGYPLICHTTQPAVYIKQIWCLIISKCNRVFCKLVGHSMSDHSIIFIYCFPDVLVRHKLSGQKKMKSKSRQDKCRNTKEIQNIYFVKFKPGRSQAIASG